MSAFPSLTIIGMEYRVIRKSDCAGILTQCATAGPLL